MAQFAIALTFTKEAESLLRLAIEIRPDFTPVRIELAKTLERRGAVSEALDLLDEVLGREPDHYLAKSLKAANLSRVGRFDECLALYEDLLAHHPEAPGLWTSYGHAMKTMGRSDEGVNAMRRAVEVAPWDGEAWWNVADLKTTRFTQQDVELMLEGLNRDSSDKNRVNLHFALGKAFEDLGDREKAFSHYFQGNQLRRQSLDYDPDEVSDEVSDSSRFFTKAFFEERRGFGSPSPEPIFILGMTRAGSTLVEQILSSHSAIEGTKELDYIWLVVREMGRMAPGYYRRLAALSGEQLRAFGEQYLGLMRSHRHEGRPFFIDKMPNNWLHAPLIHLILPNAKIIDVRRHPLACGFSNFRQHFATGQQFTYDLNWFGRFYSDYVRLMAHVDEALPGRVHRVFYERLVSDTEAEVRNLLDYVGVPFEQSCLRFYETDRAIYTPSSEQVRRPMDPGKKDDWRPFEQWLDPLKEALGPVLGAYPNVPDFESD
ncbi:MAG TPA: sulfotransferase [Sphingomicrobium sp.]